MNAEISETIKAKMLAITNILQAIIVGESSDVIKAKIANLHKTPDTSRWNKGPQFLRQPEAEWSCQEVDFTSSISTAQSVLRKHVFLVTELDHFNFAAYYFFNLKRVQGRADRLNPEEDAIVLPKN